MDTRERRRIVRALIAGILIFAISTLVASLRLPTDPGTLQAACVGIFFTGFITGLAIVAMFFDEIRGV